MPNNISMIAAQNLYNEIQDRPKVVDGINKPMRVSSFKLTETLPDKLKKYLPSPEDLLKLKK